MQDEQMARKIPVDGRINLCSGSSKLFIKSFIIIRKKHSRGVPSDVVVDVSDKAFAIAVNVFRAIVAFSLFPTFTICDKILDCGSLNFQSSRYLPLLSNSPKVLAL